MNRRGFVFALAAVTVAVGLAMGAGSKPKDVGALRAGAFAMDITPVKWPVPSNGSMSAHYANGATDPINARCLVVDDGKTKIAFCVIDACMVYREVMDEAKAIASQRTGIPIEHMLISATHAHSCPSSVAVFQAPADKEYTKFLIQRVAEGIIKAHDRLAPAQVGWAVGNDPTQVFNRRWWMAEGKTYENPFGSTKDRARMNPGYGNKDVTKSIGPVDPEVPVLAFRTPEGKPIAVLCNYSLYYVGGVPAVSADYYGEFARQLTKKIGGDDNCVVIMSNGTSGDINNVNFGAQPVKRQPGEQVRIVADSVSNAALKAYTTIQFRDSVSLDMREAQIELGVRKPSTEEVAVAKQVLASSKKKDGNYLDRAAIYATETVDMAAFPDTVKVKLQAMRIGELGIVSSPCETFVEIGLDIKKKSPLKPTFTIELANGYLPTPEQHKLGGYETWRAKSSYLEVDAATKIEATLLKLLDDVAKTR
jgi:hypothetical protein